MLPSGMVVVIRSPAITEEGSMNRSILIFLLMPLVIGFGAGCTNTNDESPENLNLSSSSSSTPVEYWAHTIDSSEVYYISDSPYGYYQVVYYDARLSGYYWYDIWFIANDGSWCRLAPVYDDTLELWYNIIYLYDGALSFNSGLDMTGTTMVIFRAAVEELKGAGVENMRDFNAMDYFKKWPPKIEKND